MDLSSRYQRIRLMPFLSCTEDAGIRSTKKEVTMSLVCIGITHQGVQIVGKNYRHQLLEDESMLPIIAGTI